MVGMFFVDGVLGKAFAQETVLAEKAESTMMRPAACETNLLEREKETPGREEGSSRKAR